jgi:hypothetical protein
VNDRRRVKVTMAVVNGSIPSPPAVIERLDAVEAGGEGQGEGGTTVNSVLIALLLCAAEPAVPDPQARYDAAVQLLLAGRLDEAATALESLAQDPAAAGPVAERAAAVAEVARAMAARGLVFQTPADGKPDRAAPGIAPPPRKLDQRGRGELAIFATLFGTWAGIGTGVVADWEDPKAYVAAALVGGGGGLALAVLGTRGRAMPEGRAQAIESAAIWGSFNGGMFAALSETTSTRDVVGATLGTGALALAATTWATAGRSPSSGDVAVTNSGGIWGFATGGATLLLLADEEPSTTVVQAWLLGAADAGLVTMALLSRNIEISRGRSLLIDAGGLLGALAGVAIPVFAESDNRRVYGGAGLAGMAGGLAAATWLTRGWDREDDERASVSGAATMPFLARSPEGGFQAGLAGRF